MRYLLTVVLCLVVAPVFAQTATESRIDSRIYDFVTCEGMWAPTPGYVAVDRMFVHDRSAPAFGSVLNLRRPLIREVYTEASRRTLLD